VKQLTAALAFLILTSCSAADQARVLTAADSMATATLHVLEWAKAHGIDAATVVEAAHAVAMKDYKTAVPLLAGIVDASIKAGDVPDQDVQAFILLAEQIVAAQALEDGTKAISVSK
jgi:hypothetical protein